MYYSAKELETNAKILIKLIFESQGGAKMAEKRLHKNVNISPKKL